MNRKRKEIAGKMATWFARDVSRALASMTLSCLPRAEVLALSSAWSRPGDGRDPQKSQCRPIRAGAPLQFSQSA